MTPAKLSKCSALPAPPDHEQDGTSHSTHAVFAHHSPQSLARTKYMINSDEMNKRITYNQGEGADRRPEGTSQSREVTFPTFATRLQQASHQKQARAVSWRSGCCQAREGLRSRTQPAVPGSLTAGNWQLLAGGRSLALNEECHLRLAFSLFTKTSDGLLLTLDLFPGKS